MSMGFFFQDGGPVMWAIAAIALAALLAAPVAGVLYGMRRGLLAALWLAPLVGLVLAGTAGMIHGRFLIDGTLGDAAPEMVSMVLARGLSVQLHTDLLARVLVLATGGFLAASVAVGHLVGTRGERGRWSLGPGLGVLAVTLLGCGLSLATGLVRGIQERSVPTILLGGFAPLSLALPVLAVAIRSDRDPARVGATAGARAAVWGATLAASWAVAGLPTTLGTTSTFRAIAMAAPEHKAELLAVGLDWARADGLPGLWALGSFVLAGPLLLVPCTRALRKATNIAGAALAALVLLSGTAAALATPHGQTRSLTMLADMVLPDAVNRVRLDCAGLVDRRSVYLVDATIRPDGLLADPMVLVTGGAESGSVTSCLTERLTGLRVQDGESGWSPEPGRDPVLVVVRWRFVMPPGKWVSARLQP